MQHTKSECDRCFREYSLELMIQCENGGPHLCIRCYNRRHKDQGTWFMNQDSRFEKTQGSGKKAQGSRVKPWDARSKDLPPEYTEMPLCSRGVTIINDFPPNLNLFICHEIWPGDSLTLFPELTFNSTQNSCGLFSVSKNNPFKSGSPVGVTASILIKVIFVNLFFILLQNFVSGFVVI